MIRVGNSYISEASISSVKVEDSKTNESFLLLIYTVNGEEYKERFSYKQERDLRLNEIIRSVDRYNEKLDLTAAIMSLKGEIQLLKGTLGDSQDIIPVARDKIYDNEPIENLNLIDSSYKSLKRRAGDVKNIGDLRRLGYNGLKRLKGVGTMRLKDIKEKYEAYTGLKL